MCTRREIVCYAHGHAHQGLKAQWLTDRVSGRGAGGFWLDSGSILVQSIKKK